MSGILVIDDAKITHRMFKNILNKAGYTVCGEALNGREGIEKFKQLNPDLVFCDIMMKEMDGIEFLKAVMAEDPEAKVVICTSAGDKHHNNEAREAGAKDFIVKPIRAADVISVTERLIGKPVPSSGFSYKKLMEEQAASLGLENRCILDFMEAFQTITHLDMGDARVDKQYLVQNMDTLMISIRALISIKMSDEQTGQLMDIFRNLIS